MKKRIIALLILIVTVPLHKKVNAFDIQIYEEFKNSPFNKNEIVDNYTIDSNNGNLSSNTIKSILITDRSDIIIRANKGLNIYHSINNKFQKLCYRNLLDVSFMENTDLDKKPKLKFDEFRVNGKIVTDINNRNFKYFENTISIKVSISNYKNNDIVYYYNLDEKKDNWTLMKTNEVVLTNLSPGKYTFKVKGKDCNNNYTDVETIKFNIKTPIGLSFPFILLYILIIIFIIYKYINRMKTLDKMVALRTAELREEDKKNNELLRKLIRLERTKNNYFINMSHEIRTPLNVIFSTEQLLSELNKSEEGISKEKLDKYIVIFDKNIKRLLKVINDLIDTSKIENGNYKLNIQEYNIVNIVEEASLGLKDFIESRGIELIIDPDIEEKIVCCDKSEIERCIINIVSNAARFTNAGGKITVKIKDLKDKVEIDIIDTGVGIEKKYQKVIFDRFNQVIDSQTEIKGGTGLGLTITKNIIVMHKGTISVESEINKGSKFIITLPAKKENNINLDKEEAVF